MFTIDMKQNVLQNIPEVGLVGVFDDEIINYNIVKDDVKLKEINVLLNPTLGIKLVGDTRWEDLQSNKELTYIQKLMVDSTDEVKSVNSTFKASNGMVCTISLAFYDDNDILTNIKDKSRFVLRFIEVKFVSPQGTVKEFTTKDLSMLKEGIDRVKGEFETKLNLLVNELNNYTGDKKLFATFKI